MEMFVDAIKFARHWNQTTNEGQNKLGKKNELNGISLSAEATNTPFDTSIRRLSSKKIKSSHRGNMSKTFKNHFSLSSGFRRDKIKR